MSAHFCTCAASAFHWPSKETLTAVVLEAAYIVARPCAARPPALRRSSSKSFGGLRQESSAELTLQLSHFLGTLLNKTYCQYTTVSVLILHVIHVVLHAGPEGSGLAFTLKVSSSFSIYYFGH